MECVLVKDRAPNLIRTPHLHSIHQHYITGTARNRAPRDFRVTANFAPSFTFRSTASHVSDPMSVGTSHSRSVISEVSFQRKLLGLSFAVV